MFLLCSHSRVSLIHAPVAVNSVEKDVARVPLTRPGAEDGIFLFGLALLDLLGWVLERPGSGELQSHRASAHPARFTSLDIVGTDVTAIYTRLPFRDVQLAAERGGARSARRPSLSASFPSCVLLCPPAPANPRQPSDEQWSRTGDFAPSWPTDWRGRLQPKVDSLKDGSGVSDLTRNSVCRCPSVCRRHPTGRPHSHVGRVIVASVDNLFTGWAGIAISGATASRTGMPLGMPPVLWLGSFGLRLVTTSEC